MLCSTLHLCDVIAAVIIIVLRLDLLKVIHAGGWHHITPRLTVLPMPLYTFCLGFLVPPLCASGKCITQPGREVEVEWMPSCALPICLHHDTLGIASMGNSVGERHGWGFETLCFVSPTARVVQDLAWVQNVLVAHLAARWKVATYIPPLSTQHLGM